MSQVSIPPCHSQLSEHQCSPYLWCLCGHGDDPKVCFHKTHLLCEPQPQPSQIGVIHNVPVGEGGSFRASRGPLKDTGHYAVMSYECSGVISLFILHSDLGDLFPPLTASQNTHTQNGPTSIGQTSHDTLSFTSTLDKGLSSKNGRRVIVRTLPSSYNRRWEQGLVSGSRRKKEWDAQHPTHLSLCPPTTRHGAGRSTY